MDSWRSLEPREDSPLGANQQLGECGKLARKLETAVDPEREKIEAHCEFTLREGVETFLGDQKARGLGK